MTRILAMGLIVLALAACTATERGATVGAVSGAAIGGAATGRVGGALAGAAIGGVAGALIGRASEPGRCVYEDRRGRRYVEPCPAGY